MLLLEVAQEQVDMVEVVEEISTTSQMPEILVSILVILSIIVGAKIVDFIFNRFMRRIAKRSHNVTPMLASLIARVVSVVIWIVAAVGVLGVFGINLTPVLAGLGITGVVLGFALQESISSLFSGMMIAINNPFRVGDWVEVGHGDGIEGTVVSMDLMCVTLATGDNKKITISNKSVWGNMITNYSDIDKRRLDLSINITRDSDPEKAKKTIRNLLESYPEVMKDQPIVVEVSGVGEAMTIIARSWVLPSNYGKVQWRFNGEIISRLHENGVELAMKQIEVHSSDIN